MPPSEFIPRGPTPEQIADSTPLPSRLCTPEENGSLKPYDPSGPHPVEVLECDRVYDGEYVLVAAKADGSAYMRPRPDMLSITEAACSEDTELARLLHKFTFCCWVSNVGVVNSIPLGDALAIARGLNERI